VGDQGDAAEWAVTFGEISDRFGSECLSRQQLLPVSL
jgi:hypothetical protein